jgi:hypothetical protein
MRAVALLASLQLIGCFPHDAHKRTLAQLVEGGTLAAGIGMEYFSNNQADCDLMKQEGTSGNCGGFGRSLDSIGMGFILAGLVGFIVTISSAEDDAANQGSGSGSAQAN